MKPNNPSVHCQNCSEHISEGVFEYSTEHFGFALCMSCQDKLKHKIHDSTPETVNLYFSLRKRGVPADLEKYDGHKTVDIAVEDAKVNIEVDGMQHHFNTRQAFSDLQRTYYAFKDGYFTLHVPNKLVKNNLQETADYITELLISSKQRKF